MASYLQQYGAGDERRNKIIRNIVLSVVAVIAVAIAAYFIFHNYPEKRKAKQFLEAVNAHDYRVAYQQWGCTQQHPCPNYDYNRFMEDWGPKKGSGDWKVASTDSCTQFLTVNVQASGTEVESLAVLRRDNSLSFAPAPECQEYKWRWKQFFQRFFGETPPPSKPSAP